MQQIIKYAKENLYKKIVGEYKPTNKNALVKDFYTNMGFTRVKCGIYELEVF